MRFSAAVLREFGERYFEMPVSMSRLAPSEAQELLGDKTGKPEHPGIPIIM